MLVVASEMASCPGLTVHRIRAQYTKSRTPKKDYFQGPARLAGSLLLLVHPVPLALPVLPRSTGHSMVQAAALGWILLVEIQRARGTRSQAMYCT